MTALAAVFGVTTVVLAFVVALLALEQRRLARRLRLAAERFDVGVVATGSGLAEATSVVERVVDRALLNGGAESVAEDRLTRALEVIPQGVVVFDDHSAIVFRNEVAAGYLTARHGEALVEEAISDLAAAIAADPDESVASRTVELFGPPRRTVVLQAAALEADGRRIGVLVVIDDVTNQRRLEAVRRDFVANISHELKTPVGALGLLAETLLAEDDPEVAERLGQRMLTEAFRVGRTIDDLLGAVPHRGRRGTAARRRCPCTSSSPRRWSGCVRPPSNRASPSRWRKPRAASPWSAIAGSWCRPPTTCSRTP